MNSKRLDENRLQKVHLRIDNDWLKKTKEEIIEPSIEIIDPHHHLWDIPRPRYLIDEYALDVSSGHNVIGSVFVECNAMYQKGGERKWQSLGETQFAAGAAAMYESGYYGNTNLVKGIVGYVDLRLGRAVEEVLAKHIEVSNHRLKGIRNMTAWHADPNLASTSVEHPHDLFVQDGFDEGLEVLSEMNLPLDVFMYHTQLDDLLQLAYKHSNTIIVLNHYGCPIGIGPFAERQKEVFEHWSSSMAKLAEMENIRVKLGGLGMRVNGFNFHTRERAPTSEELATVWQPYFNKVIELFGPSRCMFESNFPVDKGYCSYHVLWNAFKRMSKSLTKDERNYLFKSTANNTYQLGFD